MKIIIHKFKRVEDLTLNVPAEIIGGNGHGKTTILEAISFVLTGKSMQGNELKQVYDNRVDIHQAIADVSYFDTYNNEYRRIVSPIFTTNRDGEESVKILRSTRCQKNGIDCADFANEFEDFYKFGTDYFFNQKETDQRALFIDLMKSLLPDYDVKDAQTRLKMLVKTQKESVQEVRDLRKSIGELVDQESIEIPAELINLEAKYNEIISSKTNSDAQIAQINAKNNEAMSTFYSTKTALQTELDTNQRWLTTTEKAIEILEAEIESKKLVSFTGIEPVSTETEKAKISALEKELANLEYFEDINDYAKKYAKKNPVVASNISRIMKLRLATIDNLPEGEEVTNICYNCGQKSESVLAKGIENIVDALKDENRSILTQEMRAFNATYLEVLNDLNRAKKALERVEVENQESTKRAKALKRSFDITKTNEIQELVLNVASSKEKIKLLTKVVADLTTQLAGLKEPVILKLPTEIAISDELIQAHLEYSKLREKIIGIAAINRNNAQIRVKKENELKELRALLLRLGVEIAELTKEISAYFSNLTEVVKNEFKGEIEIGVQLQEYVIAQDDYKDVFKITADGKVFPNECNGALQNNVKLQVLATLQRLRGYKGITIMDNAEANTTQPIETNGLKLVVARATESKELIIK